MFTKLILPISLFICCFFSKVSAIAQDNPKTIKEAFSDLEDFFEGDEMEEFLYDLSDLSEKEQEILKSLPKVYKGKILGKDHAEEILSKVAHLNYNALLSEPGTSEDYKSMIQDHKQKHLDAPQSVLKEAEIAKEKFKKLNPDLNYGDQNGTSYTGKKGQIYLPYGVHSFADEVIAFQENDDLRFPMHLSLGPPDCPHTGEVFTFKELEGVANLGKKGQLTLQFKDNALVDINGPDLYVFETGVATESTQLEISKDGKKWILVGKIEGGISEVDIADKVSAYDIFHYVRLTDIKGMAGEPPGADIDAVAAIGSAMKFAISSEVLFEVGKATISGQGNQALEELIQKLKALTSGKVIITGHTDNTGSDELNLKLSIDRAKSVSTVIQDQLGDHSLSFQEVGKGEKEPIFPNDTEENRRKNRRVEITVVQ